MSDDQLSANLQSGTEQWSLGRVTTIGVGFLGVSAAWALMTSATPVLFQERFGLSAGQVGWISTVNNLVGIVLLPFFGGWSDRTRGRWGRRRPFIAIGAPLAALSLFLIPWSSHVSLLLSLCVFAAFNLAMAVYRSPTVALMPDCTPSRFRSQANGVINLMGGVGALLVYFFLGALQSWGESVPYTVGAIIVLVCAAIVVLGVRGSVAESSVQVPEKTRIGDWWDTSSPALKWLLAGTGIWFVGFCAMGSLFTLAAKSAYGMSAGESGKLLGVFALSFLIAAPGAGFVGARLGRITTVQTGLLALCLCLGALTVVHDAQNVVILLAIAGVSWALVNVQSLPMVLDLSDTARAGAATGVYYLVTQMASVIAPALGGQIMDQFGAFALFGFCAGCFALGMGCISKMKRAIA